MGFRTILTTILLSFVTGAAGEFALADVHPWLGATRPPENGARLVVLDDPRVDMALRVELIRRARKNIRIAVYHQMTDTDIGLPILYALRERAAKGIPIQYITGQFPAMLYDRDDLIPKLLSDSTLAWPAKIFKVGGLPNLGKGWNISDSMHEKIFLIDDEIAIIGGRNHGEWYATWLDFGALIRDARGRKGLVAQICRGFDQLWYDVAAFTKPIGPMHVAPGALSTAAASSDISLSDEQAVKLHQLVSWATSPGESLPEEFQPARARVVSHRFFDILMSGKYDINDRLNFNDDILDEAVAAAETAREIRIATIFTLFHRKMKDALGRALVRGATVHLFMNSESSSREVVPMALTYKDSLQDVVELLNLRKRDGGPVDLRVTVFTQGTYRFLHKKMFIADRHVLFGSHNFNLPSSVANSELSIHLDDERFAREMALLYDLEVSISGTPLAPGRARDDFGSTPVGRWLARFVHGFF